MALAAEQRQHIAVLFAERFRLLDIVADAGKPFKIFLDIGCGLLAFDAELIGETERGDAVDDAEVDRFRAPPHFRWHALDRHAEHLRGGHGMNILAGAEGPLQRRDVGDLRQQPEFDLRIVGGHEFASLGGDEGAADFAALLGADRDVLQVGVVAGQPPGHRHRLRIAGVNAAGVGVDQIIRIKKEGVNLWLLK